MAKQVVTNILSVTNISASGEGTEVNTNVFPTIDKNLRPQPEKSGAVSQGCLFCLDTTGFTGTDMLVEIQFVENSIDYLLGAFASVTAAGKLTLYVENCPDTVKVVYTANTVSDWDATVVAVRA